MTEQSSSKSFFGIYLRHRLRQQRMNFILCAILNVLTLPLLTVSMEKGIKNPLDDFYVAGHVGAVMSGIALFVLAVAGAVMSFEYYNKKNLTDTLGVLPITNKQRFFGDLIGGYIANVAPIIPFGAVSAAIMSTHQADFDELLRSYNVTLGFDLGALGLDLFVLMMFALTTAYLIAALVASACGKAVHSVIFSIFAIVGLPLFFGGIVRCFVLNMLGVETSAYLMKTMMFFPPLALLKNAFDHSDISSTVRNVELSDLEFYTNNSNYVIVWIALGAALVMGAYFLGKHRKPENVGSAVIIRPIVYIICGLISGGVCASILGYAYKNVFYVPITAILAGLTVCIVMLLIWLPNKKYLSRGFIAGGLSVVAAFGLCVLFDKTGSLGARYLPKNSEKISYINANNELMITEGEDIETYSSLLNELLRDYSDDIEYGDYTVEYKLTDGRTIKRGYKTRPMIAGNLFANYTEKCKTLLKHYLMYFFQSIDDNSECSVTVNNSIFHIPDEKTDEFIYIIRKEAEEKHQSGAEIVGEVRFSFGKRIRSFNIGSDFTETIAFLDSFGEVSGGERDPEEKLFIIIYSCDDGNSTRLSLTLRNKHKDNALVKELLSLLKTGADRSGADDSFGFMINKNYYVPRENSKRVLEIMLELVKK